MPCGLIGPGYLYPRYCLPPERIPSKHVGGANRTIIKLAQQLLINPAVNLAEQEKGALVRLDQIYDLVEGNIASDIRGKIAALPSQVDHPLA